MKALEKSFAVKEFSNCEIVDFDKFASLPADVQERVLEALGCPCIDQTTKLLLSKLERLGILRCL